MPSTLRMDKDRVGPGEPVRLTVTDNSIDFTAPHVRPQVMVALAVPRPLPSSGTLTHILSQWLVIGPHEIEFRVDRVGPITRGLVPPGTYEPFVRAGVLWLGNADRPLHVQDTPTAAVAATHTPALTIPVRFQLALLSARLRLRFLPTLLLSILSYMRARLLGALMGFAMRNPRILPMVPGGGPGAPGGGGPGPAAPAARGPVGYLRPFADGAEGFPAIHAQVSAAQRMCYLTTWGMDEAIRWSATGQHDVNTPTAGALLKERAVAMARLADTHVTAANRHRTYSNVRLLIWDASMDDDYGGSGNDVGGVGIAMVRWNDVRGLSRQQIGPELRRRGLSGESAIVLGEVHAAYRQLHRPAIDMPYPSGVMVTTQNHSTSPVTGSHHQKFLLTEEAAYVGGLNFHKDYWDARDHRHNQPGRASSKGLASGSGGGGPLHDTGCLLRQEECQRHLLRLFAARWDAATRRNGPFEGLVFALMSLRNQSNDRRDRTVYDALIRYLRAVPRALVGSAWMRLPFSSAPIPNAGVDDMRITLSLPRGTAWATAAGTRETLDEYFRALDRTGGPQSTVFLETQYFKDARIAHRLLQRWRTGARGREAPYAHVLIPYIPDTHWADISIPGFRVSEKRRVVRAEFQNIRWLEIHSMRMLLQQDANGRWVDAYEVRPTSTITLQGAAHANPLSLELDTEVELRDVFDVQNQVPIARMTRRVGDIMTKSDIVGYTIAMEDRLPQGGDAQSRQRQFLETNGIYVHSKAAVFLDEADASVNWATVGSANLNERSLDDTGNQDSETNVWWTSAEGPLAYFRSLAAEHLNETDPTAVSSYRLQEDGLDALNRIRTSQGPGRHLVRLDVADRLRHLW